MVDETAILIVITIIACIFIIVDVIGEGD